MQKHPNITPSHLRGYPIRQLFFTLLKSGFELSQASARDLHIVLGFASTESRDDIARFAPRDDATVPAELAGHGRSYLAPAVLVRISHLRCLGIDNSQQIRALIVYRRLILVPADDDHFRTPGLYRLSLKVRYYFVSADLQLLRPRSHRRERGIGHSIETALGRGFFRGGVARLRYRHRRPHQNCKQEC